MPPKSNGTNGALKRKATRTAPAGEPVKKSKTESPSNGSSISVAETYGIVQRKYYPPEMSQERVQGYRSGDIQKPIDTFKQAMRETKESRAAIPLQNAVVHWFRTDLRTRDNKALYMASEKAKEKSEVPIIGVYLVSPQDFEAHLTAPVRVDFILRTLKVLQADLAKFDIPLYVETVEKRRRVPDRLVELCQEWGASHIFTNVEYEVDELRRDASLFNLALEKAISFNAYEDTCVVNPYSLSTLAGGQFSVYSPWYRAWLRYMNDHPEQLEEHPQPARNPVTVRNQFENLFECVIPTAPSNKCLSEEDQSRFSKLWPAGENEAHARLQKFTSTRIKSYHEKRDLPAGNNTSVLSVHLAAGTLAARACVREAHKANADDKLGYRYAKKLEGGNAGIVTWISEVAWRDFYRHVMCHNPWVVMNTPYKPEYANIEWEYDLQLFEAWKNGRTGFPIVDAAMRQVKHSGYMHNRCRMIVASFLAKDLLIDWRMGEREFMLMLIDGDFASNNGGWGFCVGCGVDPSPWFRVFNPTLQSEKFDPNGEYIRRWVPELANIQGKAIHDPYHRGAEVKAETGGYPRPIVDHASARNRALTRYKTGIGRETA